MLRERSAHRRTQGGDGARREDRDQDQDRRTEVGLGLGWGSASGRGPRSVPGPSQPGLVAWAPAPRVGRAAQGGRWGRSRRGRSGRSSARARPGENGGAFLVQTRSRGWDRPGCGDALGRPRDPPIATGRPRDPPIATGRPRDPPIPPGHRTHLLPAENIACLPFPRGRGPGGFPPAVPPGNEGSGARRGSGHGPAPAAGSRGPAGAGKNGGSPFPVPPVLRDPEQSCPSVPLSPCLSSGSPSSWHGPCRGSGTGCSQLCLRTFGNCRQQFFALPSLRGSSSHTCQTGKVLPGRETATGEETEKCSHRTLPRESKEGRTAGKYSQEIRFYSVSAALRALQEPFAATGQRERGRLGCARLGTGTNSSLPCSGRFSGPVRDSPNGCKGVRAASELISRDKGANRVRRDPSLPGKGVGRVSPPGPACGAASPPVSQGEEQELTATKA
ncbi:collagen alpha-1(III) chain-like [Corapipo altera]|uniref:collagen alpha-1(III) chain-like n=1 Tax=Corapipo altera TaxID=415028 RepID=UPI000FD65CAF|nr:collagen alpha-1(III) chain-like [Corapipo altera]